jgi:hypothetical protein
MSGEIAKQDLDEVMAIIDQWWKQIYLADSHRCLRVQIPGIDA